jgi:hypothetical protein
MEEGEWRVGDYQEPAIRMTCLWVYDELVGLAPNDGSFLYIHPSGYGVMSSLYAISRYRNDTSIYLRGRNIGPPA